VAAVINSNNLPMTLAHGRTTVLSAKGQMVQTYILMTPTHHITLAVINHSLPLVVAVKLAVAYSSNSSSNSKLRKLQTLIKVPRRVFRALWLALLER
jgi:hypothetical protein